LINLGNAIGYEQQVEMLCKDTGKPAMLLRGFRKRYKIRASKSPYVVILDKALPTRIYLII
jgi:hypothetical protein